MKLLDRHSDFAERRHEPLRKSPPRLRQRDVPRRTVEELHFETSLQSGDCVAQRRRRLAQNSGRSAKTSVLGDGKEGR